MIEIIDGIELIVVSIGSEKRKKLAAKTGIEVVQLNQILHAGSLAKAPPNKTKAEIAAIDAANAKKEIDAINAAKSKKEKEEAKLTPSQKKRLERQREGELFQEKVKSSAVEGKAENKNFKVGSPDKAIEQDFEITQMGANRKPAKRTVPAITYGLVAVHNNAYSPREYTISLSPSGNSLTSRMPDLPKKRAIALGQELGRLDWADGNPSKIPASTLSKAQEIMAKYKK